MPQANLPVHGTHVTVQGNDRKQHDLALHLEAPSRPGGQPLVYAQFDHRRDEIQVPGQWQQAAINAARHLANHSPLTPADEVVLRNIGSSYSTHDNDSGMYGP